MPPFDLWLRGREEIRAFLLDRGAECAGSRLTRIEVNGTSGFTQHRRTGPGGALEPFAVVLLEATDGLVSSIHVFLDPAAVERFVPMT